MAAPKAITQAPTPRRISDTHYAIDSFTDTLKGYDLHMGEHGWTCTCMGYGYNRKCKHIARLHDHLSAQRNSPARKTGLKLEDLFADVA
jgi:hypothetical protein